MLALGVFIAHISHCIHISCSKVLKPQNGVSIVKHPDGKIDSQIIGSISEFLLAVDNPNAVLERMADPATKIVSLTITEGGYNFNPSTGEFDFENQDIQQELQHPDPKLR